MDTIGDRVKYLIAYKNITMTKFAQELNISQSMVSKICSGTAKPSERTISDICRVYDVNKQWLIEGKGDMIDKASIASQIYAMLKADCTNISEGALLMESEELSKLQPFQWERVHSFLEQLLKSPQLSGEKEPDLIQLSADMYLDAFNLGFKLGRYSIKGADENHGHD